MSEGAGRWAWITALLYGTALAVLAVPLGMAAFDDPVIAGELVKMLRALATPSESWGFWAVLGALTLLQGLVLLVPVRIADRHPVRRGRWVTLVAVASLLMALLVLTGGLAVDEVLRKDKAGGWMHVLPGLAGWAAWAAVFSVLARRRDDASALRGVVRTMLAGSLAELLVAVPCHVIARKRDYCCAGALTFTGLATGFAVLLFAFGPAVFFLFVDRLRRLRPAADRPDP